jgi:hypothetical protein
LDLDSDFPSVLPIEQQKVGGKIKQDEQMAGENGSKKGKSGDMTYTTWLIRHSIIFITG